MDEKFDKLVQVLEAAKRRGDDVTEGLATRQLAKLLEDLT